MGIVSFINLFKKTSMFFLKCQEHILTVQLNFFLNKNKKHLKYTNKGCSISVESDLNTKKERLNNEIKTLLKNFKNNPTLILEHILSNKTKVFKLENAQKLLKLIGEDEGLIPECNGKKAFLINLFLFKKIKFKSEAIFIIENTDIDIYKLIQQFHKWYLLKNGFLGLDEKSQDLLKQVNNGNEDSIITKLKPDDIISLQNAISRDVESINFVVQYARESAGSKKALGKILSGEGATI